MIKGMTAHNASFDDHIDNTSCFSLVFPYQIIVNSNQTTINNRQDVLGLIGDTNVEIIYPVNIEFYNYDKHEVTSPLAFDDFKTVCNEGFDISFNPCLELGYPIKIKEFNDSNNTFETFLLNHNKEAFTYFDNLHDNDVYEIQFPVTVLDSNSEPLTVNSNSDLEDTIRLLSNCE